MRKAIQIAAIATMLGMPGLAAAQAPAPAQDDADHGAHHPEQAPTAAPAPVPAPPTPNAGGAGMMGGDMARMMQMMMQMQGGMGPGQRMAGTGAGPTRMDFALHPFRRIEGQLAYYRTEMHITEAQASQWNVFADVVRAQAERLRQAVVQAMQPAAQPATAPQQIERRIALLSAQLDAMRAVAAAVGPLYAVLSEEQRRTADELMAEHFRSMRMGMF
ncbi:Spy/CpxP family protein refolding chaperone [Falsiroseomonas sp. HW251]|uniref:Spy/CpxP family protein refolding chaperone n=1 Tax=Falsiroseomonas sp. HW251 TaxID=3390998 RepID=UPI003D31EF46